MGYNALPFLLSLPIVIGLKELLQIVMWLRVDLQKTIIYNAGMYITIGMLELY